MANSNNITKYSFEKAIDALLNAHSQNSNKGKLLKEWFENSFNTSATVSHIKEDKQIGNRVAEQFKHKLPFVVFVCDEEVNRSTLINKIRESSYVELSTVLVMSSGTPHVYETLLSNEENDFVNWAHSQLEITMVPLESLSDEAKQREHDFREYLVNVVGNKRENLDNSLAHLNRTFVKDILRQYTGTPFIYETTDTDVLELVLTKVRKTKADQDGNRNSSSRISRYIRFLRDDRKLSSKKDECDNMPWQQIYYGAPGTGKSNTVNDACKKYRHHRVTFHPDSDYSTFVGCYKPTKKANDRVNYIDSEELIELSKSQKNTEEQVKFISNYAEAIALMSKEEGKSINRIIVDKFGWSGDTYMMNFIKEILEERAHNRDEITYAFTPQAFTNAYIEAWQKQAAGESVFLVIEEINRGNCAQIFGDLFQLLDRDGKGFSKYEIVPDKDLQDYIATNGKLDVSGIKDSDGNDISCEINNGSLLKLPDNLYIWATMNTSDQSLFPIDSAFKRRWDWKYVPIKNHADKNFKIKFDYEVENKYEDGNITFSTESYEQDWWNFIDAVNVRIESATHSEDKQLGYFFCNPDDGIIDGSMFVSKVIFYLWNDVFKNTGSKSVFNVNNKKVPFTAFYLIDDEEIERQKEFNPDGLNLELVKDFIEEIIKNKAQ